MPNGCCHWLTQPWRADERFAGNPCSGARPGPGHGHVDQAWCEAGGSAAEQSRRRRLDLFESPQTRVGGNGRRSMAREPQNTPCSRPLLRPRDYARQAHAPTVPRASGVKTSTAWTPPSRRGRKAHNCSLSGRTAGVSPARAEAPAEDAPSALTRRSARSYLAPTPQPATARPSAAAADPPRF